MSHDASGFRPLAEEVVVNSGELHDAGVAGRIGGDALDADVHFEQERTAGIVSDHALQPEEGAESRPARHARDESARPEICRFRADPRYGTTPGTRPGVVSQRRTSNRRVTGP